MFSVYVGWRLGRKNIIRLRFIAIWSTALLSIFIYLRSDLRVIFILSHVAFSLKLMAIFWLVNVCIRCRYQFLLRCFYLRLWNRLSFFLFVFLFVLSWLFWNIIALVIHWFLHFCDIVMNIVLKAIVIIKIFILYKLKLGIIIFICLI